MFITLGNSYMVSHRFFLVWLIDYIHLYGFSQLLHFRWDYSIYMVFFCSLVTLHYSLNSRVPRVTARPGYVGFIWLPGALTRHYDIYPSSSQVNGAHILVVVGLLSCLHLYACGLWTCFTTCCNDATCCIGSARPDFLLKQAAYSPESPLFHLSAS